MHPAKSVIAFTTLSGAGYGLLVWLAALAPFALLPAGAWFAIAAAGLALGLVAAGLLASTLHLGHPERAWRALSQWRSSWLSREGLAALATFVPAGAFALAAAILGFADRLTILAGLLSAIGALATVFSTAMIYASLKAVPAWASRATPAAYLALAGLTGAALAHPLLRLWDAPGADMAGAGVLVLGLAGLAVKAAQWHRIDTGEAASTAETATGLGRFGQVRLLEAPHDQPNYLMKEMGFAIARKHAGALRRLAMLFAFFAPAGLAFIALFVGGGAATACAVLSAPVCLAGVAIERWLFFAEARHVVTLYYGRSLAAC